MKYSVIIPTYNHCDDFLKPCVESIIKYSNIEDIELIISANGCKDNTKHYLEELKTIVPNLIVVWNDSAIGYPKAINEGIKKSTTDKLILLNNDTVLLDQKKNEWIDLLLNPFINNKDCGITCVVKEYSKTMRKHFAVFFCVMIDKNVFDKVGLLNEEYGTGSGEDMEFCIKAQEVGYEIYEALDKKILDEKYYTGAFPIYHHGEGTVHDKKLVSDWSSIFLRNAIKVAKKFNKDWNGIKYMNHKKVGVITPVHNDAEHLFHAINAVKSQTYGNVIHYIYDDGSTDKLKDALVELVSDPNIVFISSDENRGQSYGRNILISMAINDGCEYIALLDSDDFWYPTHLENAIKGLEDCDIVYSNPEFLNDKMESLSPVNFSVPHIFVGKQLLYKNFIWTPSIVLKASCFHQNLFDSELDSIEDWDMWIRLWQQGYTFKKLPETTSRYLVRESSQASKGQQKMELFNKKHKLLPNLKLHLACGHDYEDDFINIDLYAPEDAKCDIRYDVQKLPYDDNSIDQIKAFHIIEHFHFFEIQEVLKEWHRVLKPGAVLYLETPDFLETCRSFVEGSPHMDIEQWRILLYGHFFAHAWVPGQTHKFLFTETQLRTNLEWAGFKQVVRVRPASKYVMNETAHLFLTVRAYK